MLPSEVLVDVLYCVDRKGLDALQITSHILRSLVELGLNESNLRLILLIILEQVAVIPSTPYTAEDAKNVALADLLLYLRGSKVYDVSLCATGIPEDFIARLMPLKEHVQMAIHLGPPISFASEAALRTFFTDFIGCRTITLTNASIDAGDGFFSEATGGFFILPGIRDAYELNLYYVSMAEFPVQEAIEWLNSGAPNEEKKLTIETSEDPDARQDYDRLIAGLRQQFLVATERRTYTVRIDYESYEAPQVPAETTLENRQTGEKLAVFRECCEKYGEFAVYIGIARTRLDV